jgi:hypothetical protein
MAHLEGGRVVQLGGLLLDRLDDLGRVWPGVDAPQTRRAVEHAAPVRRRVVHALGGDEQARLAP